MSYRRGLPALEVPVNDLTLLKKIQVGGEGLELPAGAGVLVSDAHPDGWELVEAVELCYV